ncbi:MAG: hypothetical protein HGB19_01275 [Chlorobiales bacterium]|nr:hypothetical protein [Chlorobiales bacterium]
MYRSKLLRGLIPTIFFIPFFNSLVSAQVPPEPLPAPKMPYDHANRIDSSESPIKSSSLQTVRGEQNFKARATFLDSLKLPDEFIYKGSEKIFFDGKALDSLRYRMDYRHGILYLRYIFQDSSLHEISVQYRALPFKLRDNYSLRTLVVQKETSKGDTLKTEVARPASKPLLDDIFSGTNLRKSGTIMRGISIGSNQDLTVNSGLRLQLEGSLAPGIEVTAALTDENTPIQPEGNTQTLKEFDRVFVEVRSRYAKATIGDFNLSFTNSEFASLQRRLQGGQVESYLELGESKLQASVSVAFSRGKFNVNQFNGQDGVQGPYRLTNIEGSPFIVVLAGTERIYVDGQLQARGQTNDYVIDYSTGEITFMSRRLITQQSRIVADFEYTERLYPRSFFGSKIQSSFFNDKILFQASYLSESDDKNSPIDLTLSDGNIKTLEEAGADRFKATDTTAFVGRDASGNHLGRYIKIDTTISGKPASIFRYEPLSDNALWSPNFSFSGTGKGSYDRVSFGVYEFVGKNVGSYEPYWFLPLPQSQSLIDLGLTLRPANAISVSFEGAVSKTDLNTFSALDDSLKDGDAYKISVSLTPKNVRLFGTKIGDIDLQASQRLTTKNFSFFDRTRPVEFERDYNLIDFSGQQLFSERTSERIRNASLGYRPISSVELGYSIGQLDRDALFSSTRQEVSAAVRVDSVTSSEYNAAFVSSKNIEQDETARWLRQTGKFDYRFRLASNGFFSFWIIPFANFELSRKRTKEIETDTLRSDSHNILEVVPGFRLPDFFGQSISASYGYRTDDLFYSDSTRSARLEPASTAKTLSLNWELLPTRDLFAQFSLTRRIRRFTELFRTAGNSDNETILLRLQSRYSPYRGALETEWLYDVATEKTSKTDRQYFAVPQGSGNYLWKDANKNGFKEFSEFVPITYSSEIGDDSTQYIFRSFPSDQLIPTIDLNTSLRLRLRPFRLITRPETFFEHVGAALSTETFVRVEERSTEKDLKQIYFLNLARFQNDSTTISGSVTFQQDLYLYENEVTNVRFRYQQRRSLNQYSLGVERRLFLERGVRFVTRLGYELGVEINLNSSYNRSLSNDSTGLIATGREFEIFGTLISPDISYRPFQDLEFGLKLSYDQRTDEFRARSEGGKAAKAQLTGIQLRSAYSFRGKGRLSAQAERIETTLKNVDASGTIFELTSGNTAGQTYTWGISFDYRLSRFITTSVSYDGRSLPIGQVIHTGRAEIRAVF